MYMHIHGCMYNVIMSVSDPKYCMSSVSKSRKLGQFFIIIMCQYDKVELVERQTVTYHREYSFCSVGLAGTCRSQD